jgi:NifU-like protein involved in Fe-S cluster formation
LKIEQFPAHLQERIKKPLNRGQLTTVDSSETQFGLLSAGNAEGKVYILVDPKTKMVEKAKFLSFGSLGSILVFDAYCELLKGLSLDAMDIAEAAISSELESSASEMKLDLSSLDEFSLRLAAGFSTMVVSEPLEDKPGAYKRKDKEDMNEADLAWLPLTAPQKIAKVDDILGSVIPERTSYAAKSVSLYNVERDLKVKLQFAEEVEMSHRALIIGFVQEACRSNCHPEIIVEEVAS